MRFMRAVHSRTCSRAVAVTGGVWFAGVGAARLLLHDTQHGTWAARLLGSLLPAPVSRLRDSWIVWVRPRGSAVACRVAHGAFPFEQSELQEKDIASCVHIRTI